MNENGGSNGGREETQSLTFQGGATVDLPCRLTADDNQAGADCEDVAGCQRAPTLSGSGSVVNSPLNIS